MGDRAPAAQRAQQGGAKGGNVRLGKRGREALRSNPSQKKKGTAAKLAGKKKSAAAAKVNKKQLPGFARLKKKR